MLNKEDKKDVKDHYGKALANKVHKATDDSRNKGPKASRHFADLPTKKKSDVSRIGRGYREFGEGKYRKLTPLRGKAEGDRELVSGDKKATKFAPS